jgi:hypothetical protein
VRNIPTILSREDFFLGLNCTLPINQWYYVQGGSQPPSIVALHAFAGNSNAPIRGLLGSQEFSVAYFGFEERETMQLFIDKYNNFVVTVD